MMRGQRRVQILMCREKIDLDGVPPLVKGLSSIAFDACVIRGCFPSSVIEELLLFWKIVFHDKLLLFKVDCWPVKDVGAE